MWAGGNKRKLFYFLSEILLGKIAQLEYQELYATRNKLVFCSDRKTDAGNLSPYALECVDTHLPTRGGDAGLKLIMVQSVDTDVLVPLVRFFSRLEYRRSQWIESHRQEWQRFNTPDALFSRRKYASSYLDVIHSNLTLHNGDGDKTKAEKRVHIEGIKSV